MSKMNDEQLDNVAGGNYAEAYADMLALYNRGLMDKDVTKVEQVMHSLGFKGYKANAIKEGYDPHGNPLPDWNTPTVYVNKQGKQISREEFWKNFDKEFNQK